MFLRVQKLTETVLVSYRSIQLLFCFHFSIVKVHHRASKLLAAVALQTETKHQSLILYQVRENPGFVSFLRENL
jgi:hypothetical protein